MLKANWGTICTLVEITAAEKNVKFYTMTIDELNKRKTPIVIIDKSLEKFKGKVLFPEKLAKANKVLKKMGLPELVTK